MPFKTQSHALLNSLMKRYSQTCDTWDLWSLHL